MRIIFIFESGHELHYAWSSHKGSNSKVTMRIFEQIQGNKKTTVWYSIKYTSFCLKI